MGRVYCELCGDEHGSRYDCSTAIENKRRWEQERRQQEDENTFKRLALNRTPCEYCRENGVGWAQWEGWFVNYCPVCGRKLETHKRI